MKLKSTFHTSLHCPYLQNGHGKTLHDSIWYGFNARSHLLSETIMLLATHATTLLRIPFPHDFEHCKRDNIVAA